MVKSKSKLRKLFLSLLLIYAQLFPASGLIIEHKSLEELEEDEEMHLGI
jgi:hypothetical protein